MGKTIRKFILLVAVLFIVPPGVARAETTINVLQAYISEQTITVFTNTPLHSDSLKCSVSNRNTDILAHGPLSDNETTIKTTVLLDISTSMPSTVRNDVLTALKPMIDSKSGNEEFRIVVFGDELITLQDFSSDRYDLANAVDKIVFNGTQSKIYDAIFNTIPVITGIDGKPTFYRTIVITDGVDDTESGITKEELFIKLQNERYPIDVVVVSSKETVENKELAAIVRMSGGRYNSLNPNSDTTALAEALKTNNYFYFEANVPSVLLDGTTRQVDISDGVNNISIDVKFPVFNAPVAVTEPPISMKEPEGTEETPAPTDIPATPIPSLPVETNASGSSDGSSGDYTIVIFIGAGVASVILVAVIIAAFVVRSKNKKSTPSRESSVSAGHSGYSGVEKTEFLSDVSGGDSQYTIKVSHSSDSGKTWTLAVIGDLLVGRAEHCQICLDDKSVSREQCKIVVQDSGLIIIHLGSTNKTILNGSNVVGSSPLQSGDAIKIGRETLRIDYIQALGTPVPKREQPQSSSNGNTESIF